MATHLIHRSQTRLPVGGLSHVVHDHMGERILEDRTIAQHLGLTLGKEPLRRYSHEDLSATHKQPATCQPARPRGGRPSFAGIKTWLAVNHTSADSIQVSAARSSGTKDIAGGHATGDGCARGDHFGVTREERFRHPNLHAPGDRRDHDVWSSLGRRSGTFGRWSN